jgi:O-antigen/teichoic acid export membrane protein
MFLKKISIYSVGEIFNLSTRMVILFLCAKILSKSDFGHYNYILASVGVVIIFLDAGLNMTLLLRASGAGLSRLFKVFVAIKLVLMLIALSLGLVLNFTSFELIPEVLHNSLITLILLSIGWDFSTFLAITHRANFDFSGEAIAKLIWSLAFLIFLLISYSLSLEMTATYVAIIQLLGFAIAIVWSLNRIYCKGIIVIQFDKKVLNASKAAMAISIPFVLSAAPASLLNSIDLIFMGNFSNLEYLASFAIAHKFTLLMYLPLSIAQAVFLPILSARSSGLRQPPKSKDLGNALKIGGLAAIALSQLCILTIDWIIIPILGVDDYSEVAWIVRVLILYLPLMFAHSILWTILVAMRFTVVSNMPAAIIVVVIATYDYVVLSQGWQDAIVWSPVIANFLMLAGLSFVYFKAFNMQPISAVIAILFIILILLMMVLSYASQIDGVEFALVRFGVILLSLMASYVLFKKQFNRI